MSGISADAVAKLDALRALLSLEESTVLQQTHDLVAGKTSKELESAGVLLRKARVVDVSAAMFGRARLTLGDDPARAGHTDSFEVRPGAVVWLMEKGDDGQLTKAGSAVVARRRRGEMELVLDSASAHVAFELDTGSGVDVVRAFDDVTLRRMRDGLDACKRSSGRTAKLIEIVLGCVKPKPVRMSTARIDDALNDDQQRAALCGVLADDVALIHGPPGTGKTRVLVEVVQQCVARGERVLCATASNAAIDHLALSLLAADPSLRLARLGNPARVHDDLEAHTLAALTDAHERRKLARDLVDQAFRLLRTIERRSDSPREKAQRRRELRAEAGRMFTDARLYERQAADDVLSRTGVLCGTLTGLRDDVMGDDLFDVLVVDEASQALTPALLLAVLRAKRVVLAGDHKQLPPTVISPEAMAQGLARTAFEALCTRDVDGAVSHMLTVQHRMHTALMAFPSARFYGGKLTAHASVAHHTLADVCEREPMWLPRARILDVIDTAGTGHEERTADASDSKENPGEAALVDKLVRDLVDAGLHPSAIGLIAPYAAQVGVLSQLLSDVVDAGLEIDSVDGFQGREKEAIVFSCVRSNSDAIVGFLADVRRLNVAITRAKRKLVVVGDSATLSADPTWRAFFDHAIAHDSYRSAFELGVEL